MNDGKAYRAGVRFTTFPKATTLPTASTPPVFLNCRAKFLHDTRAFLSAFQCSPFIRSPPVFFKMNIAVGLFLHILCVHSFPVSYLDQGYLQSDFQSCDS